jgi:nucleotide-binding universal stress UspA family protein
MKILIATDGSEYSIAAIAECLKFIAHPAKTDIKIVSAFEDAYVMAAEPYGAYAPYSQKLSDAAMESAKLYVAAAERIFRERLQLPVRSITSETINGPAEIEIVEAARRWRADLIVVGSHGRGFWGRLLGSVSDAVVHHAPCSVLVVRKPLEP